MIFLGKADEPTKAFRPSQRRDMQHARVFGEIPFPGEEVPIFYALLFMTENTNLDGLYFCYGLEVKRMQQTVYVDVLLAVNLFVNYFLLLTVRGFLHIPCRRSRLLLGAAVGALGAC